MTSFRTPHGRRARRAATGAILIASAAAVSGLTGTVADPAAADPTGGYRAQYHFTVPDHWKNDPQRPVYVDGKFHYYYLYNSDYNADPAANFGTEWRLATTYDGVVFADQGIAAPKKTNANYDLWSGSAVVDSANTAGFGAGAVVMLVTQMDHPTPAQQANASGPQAQFLWYSIDGGRTFQPHGEQPVIPNEGRKDFRDPKVVWDAERGRWVALIAERDRVSFYTSANLTDWTRVWEYVNPGIGTIECPDLFRIRADDGTMKWVLGVSANGYATNEPATYAYWTGAFDGTSFQFDDPAPQWLDHGFDWYGAVTWEDPAAPLDRRYASAWMNNWDYAHTTPTWTEEGFNGTDSITREVRLERFGSSYSLVSQPVAALQDIATEVTRLGDVASTDSCRSPTRATRTSSRRMSAGRLGGEHRPAAAPIGGRLPARRRRGHRRLRLPQPRADRAPGEPREAREPDAVRPGCHDRPPADPRGPDDRRGLRRRRPVRALQPGVRPAVGSGHRPLHLGRGRDVLRPHDHGVRQRRAAPRAHARRLRGRDVGRRGGPPPARSPGRVRPQADLPGRSGRRVADTFAGADAATGTITSPPFTLDRNFLHFLIGGGDHPLGVEPATSVQLLVDGRPVRTATGADSAALRHVEWDVRDLAGQTAQFQILDDATGEWGHLMVDHVTHSD